MSEYLDTTREKLEYEIEVDTNFDRPQDRIPDPNTYTDSIREILDTMVKQRTQQLQMKINDMDRKLKMLLGEI